MDLACSSAVEPTSYASATRVGGLHPERGVAAGVNWVLYIHCKIHTVGYELAAVVAGK